MTERLEMVFPISIRGHIVFMVDCALEAKGGAQPVKDDHNDSIAGIKRSKVMLFIEMIGESLAGLG